VLLSKMKMKTKESLTEPRKMRSKLHPSRLESRLGSQLVGQLRSQPESPLQTEKMARMTRER